MKKIKALTFSTSKVHDQRESEGKERKGISIPYIKL